MFHILDYNLSVKFQCSSEEEIDYLVYNIILISYKLRIKCLTYLPSRTSTKVKFDNACILHLKMDLEIVCSIYQFSIEKLILDWFSYPFLIFELLFFLLHRVWYQLTCLLPQGVPSAMGAVWLKHEYPSNVHHRLPQSVCNQIVRATSRRLKEHCTCRMIIW